MATLSFDTLKLARRSSRQAGDTAEALAESLRETADLATRHDLVELRAELKTDFVELRAELKGDIAVVKADLVELRAELKGDIAVVKADLVGLRAEVKGGIAGAKADIADLRSELYRALWLQAAGIVGVLSAVGALLKVLA